MWVGVDFRNISTNNFFLRLPKGVNFSSLDLYSSYLSLSPLVPWTYAIGGWSLGERFWTVMSSVYTFFAWSLGKPHGTGVVSQG